MGRSDILPVEGGDVLLSHRLESTREPWMSKKITKRTRRMFRRNCGHHGCGGRGPVLQRVKAKRNTKCDKPARRNSRPSGYAETESPFGLNAPKWRPLLREQDAARRVALPGRSGELRQNAECAKQDICDELIRIKLARKSCNGRLEATVERENKQTGIWRHARGERGDSAEEWC